MCKWFDRCAGKQENFPVIRNTLCTNGDTLNDQKTMTKEKEKNMGKLIGSVEGLRDIYQLDKKNYGATPQ
jgi:hypothetical protein